GPGHAQGLDLLPALGGGHGDDGAVAAAGAQQRQADAGIAGGALDDGRARAQRTAALGIQQQAQRGAVLDRAARVEELGLAEDLAAGQLRGAAQADQRGVADRGGQVGAGAHAREGQGVGGLPQMVRGSAAKSSAAAQNPDNARTPHACVAMKIASWNVNSLNVRMPHLEQWLRAFAPDIVGLQETKLEDHKFPDATLAALGYRSVFSGQKTYNGVAILSREAPRDVLVGVPGFE